ncbi:c-type cytochrome [Rhodoferax sp.]|uniref:c-type cytochrome n=1 Tax=Rhodoferax sp. TaxID=50421 RepID=UPI00276D41A8|nr:c-type cytochrome [Rhodoferax sp.]
MKKILWSLSVALVTSVTCFSAAAQTPVGDIKAGEKKVAMCIGCHGIAGYQASFPEIHKVPMISGQGAKYIMAALTAYQKGERRHPTMRGIAYGMSEQDMADVAVYYEAHGRTEGTAELPKAAAGSAKAMALLAKGGCVACHGESFSKPLDPSYPKIAGQHGDYLFVALKSYKADKAALVGRSNGVMAGIAGQFSNAELKELASYVASLPGELKTVPQAKFR